MTGCVGPGAGYADTADRVAAAVLAVPGVAGLHGGTFGEAAAYLPGRRVLGVRLRPGTTQVHVVVDPGVASVPETSAGVREAVARVRSGAVDVSVEDLADPAEDRGAGRADGRVRDAHQPLHPQEGTS